jgi:hypothetical protein
LITRWDIFGVKEQVVEAGFDRQWKSFVFGGSNGLEGIGRGQVDNVATNAVLAAQVNHQIDCAILQ